MTTTTTRGKRDNSDGNAIHCTISSCPSTQSSRSGALPVSFHCCCLSSSSSSLVVPASSRRAAWNPQSSVPRAPSTWRPTSTTVDKPLFVRLPLSQVVNITHTTHSLQMRTAPLLSFLLLPLFAAAQSSTGNNNGGGNGNGNSSEQPAPTNNGGGNGGNNTSVPSPSGGNITLSPNGTLSLNGTAFPTPTNGTFGNHTTSAPSSTTSAVSTINTTLPSPGKTSNGVAITWPGSSDYCEWSGRAAPRRVGARRRRSTLLLRGPSMRRLARRRPVLSQPRIDAASLSAALLYASLPPCNLLRTDQRPSPSISTTNIPRGPVRPLGRPLELGHGRRRPGPHDGGHLPPREPRPGNLEKQLRHLHPAWG